MPIRKEIVYPIFLECCQHTNDIFWDNVFEDLAYGKAPYGTYISKDFLCCSYKKKEFSYKIEKKSSETIYNEVYNLLTKKLGLFSPREKASKKKAFNDLEAGIKKTRENWSDIKKKNVKELLIELYVTRMKHKYSLSINQSRFLLSVILIAIVFKAITADDIDYQNGKIMSIRGIDFDTKKVHIKRDLYSVDVNFDSSVVSDKKVMSSNWKKYLEGLRKMSDK